MKIYSVQDRGFASLATPERFLLLQFFWTEFGEKITAYSLFSEYYDLC